MNLRRITPTVFFSLILMTEISLFAQSSDDQQQIRSAEQSLALAEGHSDSGPFKKIMANDWITVTPDGRVLQKDEVVRNIADHEGEAKPYVVQIRDIRIDILGDTAVSAFTREYRGGMGEAKGKVMREAVVHVFTRTAGEWKLHYEKAVPNLEPKSGDL